MNDQASSETWPPPGQVCPFRGFIPEPAQRAEAPDRWHVLSNRLFPFVQDHLPELEMVRQIPLMHGPDFVDWCKKRGLDLGAFTFRSEATALWRFGWLRAEYAYLAQTGRLHVGQTKKVTSGMIGDRHPASGRWGEYQLQFHPFRIYPALQLTQAFSWRLTSVSSLYPARLPEYAKQHGERIRRLTQSDGWTSQVDHWNGIADLAILLEPLYWDRVATFPKGFANVANDWSNAPDAEATRETYSRYRVAVTEMFARIPKALVASAHMELRHTAGWKDGSMSLYLILRAASWSRREQIVGPLGCALWLRHMAEVIRHMYDEVYEDRLVHEDEAFGFWSPGTRKWLYGSDYPLEDIDEMKRRIMPKWGLNVGSRVRFYVEGTTEEGALESALNDLLGHGIDIVNLKGRNWDTWLRQELESDKRAKRFSFLMLDSDREDNVRAVQKHQEDGIVKGKVFLNEPDLEYGCFDLNQLCRALALFEADESGDPPSPLAPTAFEGLVSGKQFEERYKSLRPAQALKGKTWGRALVRVAFEARSDEGDESNRLVNAVRCAQRGVVADYDEYSPRGDAAKDGGETVVQPVVQANRPDSRPTPD